MDIKRLHELADKTFDKRAGLLSLWQEMAMNFYPERADFTYHRTLGIDFASNLMSSYPIIVRRDMADQITTMLRPTEKVWFHMSTIDERIQDNDSRGWLEYATTVMRRAMYDRHALFNKATKQGDNDYACFGQTVISVELNRHATGLLYRCWHLRDVAWFENSDGKISAIFRKWKPSVRELRSLFPKAASEKLITRERQDPFAEIECMHLVVESDLWDGKEGKNKPYVSIYYDVEHETLLEAVGVMDMIYVIPRWQTVSGTQYAFSPATVAALPEARLLQAMAYTLLEAGEKATNPPLIADQNIFRTDVALYAGGITWADLEGDGKLSDYLHVLTNDKTGMPLGVELLDRSQRMMADAFYLNALRPFNPTSDPQMTAFQAGQIVQDYIRKALPLFEPMEADYNGGLCEATFNLLMRGGAFGPPQNMPPQLRGAEIQFRFKSPLHDAIEQMKGQVFLQAKQLIAEAVALDPSAAQIMDAKVALRDALTGIAVPASWTRSEADVAAAEQEQKDAQATAQFLAAAQGGANVAKTISESRKNMADAQPVAPVQ